MRKAGCYAATGWLRGQGSMCKGAQLAHCSGTVRLTPHPVLQYWCRRLHPAAPL